MFKLTKAGILYIFTSIIFVIFQIFISQNKISIDTKPNIMQEQVQEFSQKTDLDVENENEIRSLNTNGDVNFFMNLEDIDNPESRNIRISDMLGNGCITRDENTIYFYDSSYGSLRKIEHLR